MTTAGEVIKICRLRSKATRKDLATMLGISTQTIWQYEEGMHEPRFSFVYELLQVLGYEMVIRKKEENGSNERTGAEGVESTEDSRWKLQL